MADSRSILEQKISMATPKGVTQRLNAEVSEKIAHLRTLVYEVDKPVFKALGADMLELLNSFIINEEVLCCLLKNLMQTLHLTSIHDTVANVVDKQLKKQTEDSMNSVLSTTGQSYSDIMGKLDSYSLEQQARIIAIDKEYKNKLQSEEYNISEVLGAEYGIDLAIVVIDIILVFLQLEIRQFVIPLLDISSDIANEVIGFVIVALQQILETLRDSSFAWVIDQIKDLTDSTAFKCIPFERLMDIIQKYIHDYGFLKKLFDMITGQIAQMRKKFDVVSVGKSLEAIKTIEFLKWIRELLVKLKEATIAWELCVDPDLEYPDLGISEQVRDILGDEYYPFIDTNGIKNPSQIYQSFIGDNDTILTNESITDSIINNPKTTGNTNNNGYNAFGKYVVAPTDNEVNSFLVNRLNLPKDIADRMTHAASTTNTQGTLSDIPTKTNNDCGHILDNGDITRILNKIRRR